MAGTAKHALGSLGGLVVTFATGRGLVDDRRVAELLEASILLLLQYDGEPVKMCNQVWDQTKITCEEGETGTTATQSAILRVPCLTAYALNLQVLASLRIIGDLAPIDIMLSSPLSRKQYEDWELAHFELVVDFVKTFDLSRISLLCKDHMLRFPQDIFTLRLFFICAVLAGDMTPLADVASHLLRDTSFNLSRPYVMSWIAFALEEGGDLSAADVMNAESIHAVQELNFSKTIAGGGAIQKWTHPFAVHVVCHIFESRHDPLGGLAAVDAIPPDLWVDTSFLIVHLHWHLALFNLDAGNIAESLNIYDKQIFPRLIKEDLFAMCDATALLCRLKILCSVSVDSNSSSALYDARVDGLVPFWNVHNDSTTGGRLGKLVDCNFFAFHLIATIWMASSSNNSSRLELPADFNFCRSQIIALIGRWLLRHDTSALDELLLRVAEWKEVGGSHAQRDLVRRFVDNAKSEYFAVPKVD